MTRDGRRRGSGRKLDRFSTRAFDVRIQVLIGVCEVTGLAE
jgi:hypothetical protein